MFAKICDDVQAKLYTEHTWQSSTDLNAIAAFVHCQMNYHGHQTKGYLIWRPSTRGSRAGEPGVLVAGRQLRLLIRFGR